MVMHGEYKTPGGKLVVADFDVRAGRLADVRISGDFFLYPDDALPLINEALEGAAADATAFLLEARIIAALPPEVEMLGFSPAAVAEAVVRGLIGYELHHDA
jgi:lipoate-protein ligase A